MSFVRAGRSQQQTKAKRPVRPKKAVKKEWVSEVSDLSVHKLTPAELSHRHEIHKSHNKAAAQWELREKALKRRLRHSVSPAPLDPTSLSIIREVFSDQMLLQDVLARSDKAMAVVKDLFGDAPRRQIGHPSVTVAPNCDSESALPVLQRPDPPTQLSLLSQSMMDQQALNEIGAPEEDCSDEDMSPAGTSDNYVIRRAYVQKMKALSLDKDKADRFSAPVTPCTSGKEPDKRALNATAAVKRVQSRQNQSEEGKDESSVLVSQVLNPELPLNQSGVNGHLNRRTRKCVSRSLELDGSSFASLSGDQSSLGLLQAMLGEVEADLDTLSPSLEAASAQCCKQSRAQGLTGFSVALVSSLGRLVQLFKQREEEGQKEACERRRLEEEVREQRGLIDALTAETMTLREEVAALQAGLLQRTAELEQKVDTVVLVMGELGLLEAHTDPSRDSSVKAAGSHSLESALVVEQHLKQLQPSVSPALLPSPPRQRENLQQIPVQLHQELSAVGNPQSCQDVQAHSSASSLASLPLTGLPSTSPSSVTSAALHSCLSPEELLTEIALLNTQNNLIKAQLSHAQSLGSSVRGSPDSICSNGQRRLSCGSTGRVTPTSAGDRRMPVSSSKGKRSLHEGEQQITQVSPNPLSVDCVEQRLMELNRQSAAARGRLLELIEQQKQSVSNKVSPSGSPIPPSAVGPHATAEGGSPVASKLLSAQGLLPESYIVGRQSAGSEVSLFNLEVEQRESKAKMVQRRERDGWFALSTHVR
ncbi:spindle and centriole-associated protein 1 [Cheilinus undulatus]|uniref:spindle and centriole-associated protein 1 n=1 Tax=Cheilinus undulatus TaxID=241271 RepID=UPI001BD2E0E7|nr:spindle and centriole-associated protein 1 [Cheilinus undulatus]